MSDDKLTRIFDGASKEFPADNKGVSGIEQSRIDGTDLKTLEAEVEKEEKEKLEKEQVEKPATSEETEEKEIKEDEKDEYSKNVNKRIRQLTAKYRQEERARLREQEQNKQLLETVKVLTEKIGKPKEEEFKIPSRPKLDNFDTEQEYNEAMDEYEMEKNEILINRIKKEFKSEPIKETSKEELKINPNVNIIMEEGNKKYSEFNNYVQEITEYLTPQMDEFIVNTNPKIAVEIVNHFANNPDELDRIAVLSPTLTIREMVKLESKIEQDLIKPPTPKPKPFEPLVGGDLSEVDLEKLPVEGGVFAREYEKRYHKKIS